MPGEIQLEGLTKAFGEHVAVAGIDVDMPPGRVLHAARPVRLREDDDAADDRRLRAADERPDHARRHRRRARPAAPAQRQHGVPELRAVPAPRRGQERRVRAQVPEGRQERAGQARGAGARARQPDRVRAPQGRPALRRPAAAGRAGAGARAAAARAAARRAARRARRQAAQDPPGRAQGAAVGARDHVRVRHPRSGGGAHDERPDRGDEQGPGRAGGVAAVDLRGADDGVRGRVPRRVEPARGGGGRAATARRAPSGSATACSTAARASSTPGARSR